MRVIELDNGSLARIRRLCYENVSNVLETELTAGAMVGVFGDLVGVLDVLCLLQYAAGEFPLYNY